MRERKIEITNEKIFAESLITQEAIEDCYHGLKKLKPLLFNHQEKVSVPVQFQGEEFFLHKEIATGGFKKIYDIGNGKVIAIALNVGAESLSASKRWYEAIYEEVYMAKVFREIGLHAIDYEFSTIQYDGHTIPVLLMSHFNSMPKKGMQIISSKDNGYDYSWLFGTDERLTDKEHVRKLVDGLIKDIIILMNHELYLASDTVNYAFIAKEEKDAPIYRETTCVPKQELRLFGFDFSSKMTPLCPYYRYDFSYPDGQPNLVKIKERAERFFSQLIDWIPEYVSPEEKIHLTKDYKNIIANTLQSLKADILKQITKEVAQNILSHCKSERVAPEAKVALFKQGLFSKNITHDDNAPLALAVLQGEFEIAHALIYAQEINEKYLDGKVIQKIISANRIDTLKLLRDQGADIDFQIVLDHMETLSKEKLKEWVDFILLAGRAYVRSHKGNTALHIAILNDDIDCVRALLKHASYYTTNDNDETPLQVAAKRGNIEIFKLCCPYYTIKSFVSDAIKIAIKNDQVKFVQEILTKDFFVDSEVFINAVKYNQLEMVKVLIEKNLIYPFSDSSGNNAISYAIKNKNPEMISILLQIEGSVFIYSIIESGLLFYALESKNLSWIHQLINKIPQVIIPKLLEYLNQYSFENSLELTQLLIEEKAINAQGNYLANGNTPLHIFVEKNNLVCIKALIAAKADLNLPNYEGDTPLIVAAKLGHFECLKILLAAGANSDLINHKYKTAKDYIKEYHPGCLTLFPVQEEKEEPKSSFCLVM